MPLYREPESFRQATLGGWTCSSCDRELDRHGVDITSTVKPSSELTSPQAHFENNNDGRSPVERVFDQS